MKRGWLLIAALLLAPFARAAEPTTQPISSHRIPPLSIQEAQAAMGLLGPVRVANYKRTFLPPTVDPHQRYRDRYNYLLPPCSPYFFCNFGYPYYGGSCGYGCWYNYGSWISPASSFYGD